MTHKLQPAPAGYELRVVVALSLRIRRMPQRGGMHPTGAERNKKIRFEVSDERQSTCFSGGLASTVAKAKAKMLESFIFTGFLLLFFMSDTNRTTESVF